MKVLAIAPEILAQLLVLDDAGRAPVGVVDEDGGSPLRCCLTRARPGEPLALVSYAPLRRWADAERVDPGPYDEQGPVFIHAEPCAGPAAEGIPAELSGSRRVLRAYDRAGRIHGGRMAEPGEQEAVAEAWFADPEVAVVHVRAVEYGCFAYELRR